MLDSMYKTMSISSGLYPNLDLWNANKLQLQLQLHKMKMRHIQKCALCMKVMKHKILSYKNS